MFADSKGCRWASCEFVPVDSFRLLGAECDAMSDDEYAIEDVNGGCLFFHGKEVR